MIYHIKKLKSKNFITKHVKLNGIDKTSCFQKKNVNQIRGIYVNTEYFIVAKKSIVFLNYLRQYCLLSRRQKEPVEYSRRSIMTNFILQKEHKNID